MTEHIYKLNGGPFDGVELELTLPLPSIFKMPVRKKVDSFLYDQDEYPPEPRIEVAVYEKVQFGIGKFFWYEYHFKCIM